MAEWAPDEVTAHMQYMRDFADRLVATGEFVDAQALAPEGNWVQYGGEESRRSPTVRSPRPKT